MKPSSAKAKGMRLQKWVVNKIKGMFNVDDTDIKSIPSGVNGEDIWMSRKVRLKLPLSFECKSRKKLVVYDYYKQCCNNSNGYEPIVIIKEDREKPLVIVDFDYFLELHK